jgi:hypothetical protein
LPDGLFSDQKSPFGLIFVGLGMENVGIFYGHFDTFKSIWCILPPFGIFVVIWYIFSHLGMLEHEKSGNSAASLKWKRQVIKTNHFFHQCTKLSLSFKLGLFSRYVCSYHFDAIHEIVF